MQAALTPSPDAVPPVETSTEEVGAPQVIEAPALSDVTDAPSPVDNGMDGYLRLQRRMLLSTVCVTALAVPLTALWFDRSAALSLLVGALAGLLYLRLLSRSVSRFGVATKSMGKVQLLVPVVLVLAAARLPALEILPALVGFLLYKPALIAQAVLDT
ncbi:ATP synthase subunit I [Synechococcus sp. CCY 9618]|uniref:ATP synthase subunit I n=1 Tax=Synechococcus sp. CCY 9618 TaxID=2815602 RepID=UPI0020B1D388|nr:ATP synthase subunit I [Synechococcus sp. CCY 9618]